MSRQRKPVSNIITEYTYQTTGFSFHSFHSFCPFVNTLSEKAGENIIWLGGGVRFLDMQLQERQYILVIIVNSYPFM